VTTPHLIVLSVLPGAKLSCIFQITNSRAEYSNAHSVVLIPLFFGTVHITVAPYYMIIPIFLFNFSPKP